MTHDSIGFDPATPPVPEPLRAADGTALTRVVGGVQQCLRCGRFPHERCNGAGRDITPCPLGRPS